MEIFGGTADCLTFAFVIGQLNDNSKYQRFKIKQIGCKKWRLFVFSRINEKFQDEIFGSKNT